MSSKRHKYDLALRKAWIAALRGKAYNQGFDRLHDLEDRFCVLGVLVDLYIKQYGNRVPVSKNADGYVYGEDAFIVPILIADTVGLTDRDGRFRDRYYYNMLGSSVECSLATLNDRNVSFAEMADIIANPRCGMFLW